MSLVDSGLGHDRKALAASLRLILEKLGASNLTPQTRSGFVPEAQVATLKELFVDLQVGWRKRVARVLGQDKLELITRLLASPTPDVLRILGREDHENSHSDLIAWLLTPWRAPAIAPLALRRLVGGFDQPDAWRTTLDTALATEALSIRREMPIGRELANSEDRCRVDIVVSGPGFVVAIENKVWSTEHSDQTTTYWGWLDGMRCLKGGLFVSPSGMTAASPNFHTVSYLDLVSALLEGPVKHAISATEEIVLASYLKTLARTILPVEMRAVVEAASHEERT
ncbi:MAG: hypothetical protein JWP01_3452 [Myxococcales bacterium]|nr:hypothetical protein [Myxococcales bacterium]